ncbi:glutaredoxin-related protein 5, mitochondrial [Nilaparvata lugens]|uniref:glutaredoxin-related protein 5, mitochondrial n=1 Tax=Nilaparvata lugens TaxID=108931 RepID=UPI00193E2AEC|nr:glutaredoxin-related protein 5, mitochondrial [Nilaparvata lugens]
MIAIRNIIFPSVQIISRSNSLASSCFIRGIAQKVDIDKLVKNNKVVLFMKGVPEEPRCGFSNAVVQILRMHNVKYDAHDVMKDDAIRNGVKEYSNWPTIPQVFINGEFVGGCDIMLQMHQSGDLIKELEKAGIKSALLDQEAPQEAKK